MKLIDKNGRIGGKVSVIDVVVVLVIAVLALSAYMKFNVIEDTATTVKTVPIEYTVQVRGIRQVTAESYREGDALYNEAGIHLGRVSKVEIAPATTLSSLPDGTYTIAPVNERVDLTLTVAADCSLSSGRYYVDRTFELNVNSDYKFRSKYVDTTGTILSIDSPIAVS
ncbi:MAG: DUF4330 domain-containing protein [Oscillospiraceae bacterium]|jgi:hypothetical protein|nr:DUF4330 domain-containing protein [Oscillospiraceae bacterium]